MPKDVKDVQQVIMGLLRVWHNVHPVQLASTIRVRILPGTIVLHIVTRHISSYDDFFSTLITRTRHLYIPMVCPSLSVVPISLLTPLITLLYLHTYLGSIHSPSVCTTCGGSTYSTMGSSACIYSLQTTGCPAGTYPVAPNQCVACPAGSYSLGNAPSCTLCPIGTYCPNIGLAVGYGAIRSTSCPSGTYQDTVGQSTCKSCPLGTYNPTTHAASLQQCINCSPGTYGPSTGLSSCLNCGLGTYSANNGSSAATTCVQCTPGYYNNLVGQATCTPCNAGPSNPWCINKHFIRK